MRPISRQPVALLPLALLIGIGLCRPAPAQEGQPQSIPFADGALAITQKEEYGEKTLSFGDKELASAYVVHFDRIVDLAGTQVALFDVGDGGNACGPAKIMVWKGRDGSIERAGMGEDDCGAPVTAASGDALYFVPWLMPGADGVVTRWTPDAGFSTAGTLTYAPQPGTGWKDIDPAKLANMIDAFRNEAVYGQAVELLDDSLEEVVTSLMVGGAPEKSASGLIYGDGCIPHACSTYDGFMAIDPANERLYFARQTDEGKPQTWPAAGDWPAEARAAMEKALEPRR